LKRAATAQAATALGPAPEASTAESTAIFSPRTSLAALDWYAQLAANAERALFMTFAFGMNDRFVPVYDQTDDVLRFALMEKKGNGSTFKKQAAEIDRIRRRPNTTVAVGAKIQINQFDRWLAEIDEATAEAHVLYVHTKYMLIDPLGAQPIVVVGSANFSKASTDTNDENMLVIRGNKAVADVYLGEFMRLFTHYAFRESLKFKGATTPAQALKRKHLIEDSSWIDQGYFRPGADRFLRRRYFSG
jgi:phosphatidylserine/phosphatidylglycerophosphate/cardiolipin synthase-like enzyme